MFWTPRSGDWERFVSALLEKRFETRKFTTIVHKATEKAGLRCLQNPFKDLTWNFYSEGCKGNDTANCVKSMKLDIVVSFKILIRNFEGATILGHMTDDVSSLYEQNFLPVNQIILYTAENQILCWLIFAEEPYPENQWFLSYSPSNIIWWRHHPVVESRKFQKIFCDTYHWKYDLIRAADL